MKNGRCSKGYPFPFLENTVLNDGRGFIQPKRPAGGPSFELKGQRYDVRDMVPTNHTLLNELGCHINVMGFKDIQQLTYITKYMTKGVFMTDVEFVHKNFNYEIRVITCCIICSLFDIIQLQNPERPTPRDLLHLQLRIEQPRPAPRANVDNEVDEPSQQPAPASQGPVNADTPLPDQAPPNNEPVDAAAEGHQRAKVYLDEITHQMNCRVMTAPESAYKLFNFEMHRMSLKVHDCFM
jgi:hypothetical protein